MQEGARQHIQGDQGHGDQIARRPDAILLTAPLPRVAVVPAGILIADKLLLSVGSRHFVDESDAPNITASLPLEAWWHLRLINLKRRVLHLVGGP